MSYDHTIKKATTSKIVEVMLRDSTTGAGKTSVAHGSVTASYVREGGSRVAITVASGSAGDSYSSGKWAAVDGTNTPGLYQLHLPDAALAAGANAVSVFIKTSGVIDKVIRISLIDADLRNATSLGLTNLATAVSTPPAVGAIADAVLDEALSGHTSSGTLGKAIGDGVTAWVTATGFNTTTPPTVSAIADAVLDEALSGHTGSGSLGKAIGDGVTAWVTATGFNTTTPPTTAAIADAVLDEALSGHTSSGTLGKAVGDGVTAWVTANIGSLNNLSAADVNTQVDTALSDIHLDHLLAVDYDPASKPGVATALLNELIQNDGGVSQFSVNALERAPSGGGGGVVGSGSTAHEVTINAGGNPQDGAEVYVTTDSAGTNVVAGTLHTNAQGKATFQLDAATYYLWVQKAGVNFTNPTTFTVS
jgi:hypothetical protein